MTNLEAIKNMNLKELAYTFYIMLRPWLEDYSEAERKAAYDMIEQWLKEEVKNEA